MFRRQLQHHYAVFLNMLRRAIYLLCCIVISVLLGCAPTQHITILPTSGFTELDLIFRDAGPIVDLRIGEKKIPVLFDLGGFSTISLTESVLSQLPVQFTGGTRKFSDAYGQVFTTRDYIIPECSLGGIQLRDIEATEDKFNQHITDEAQNGYLGLGVLRHFQIILDYQRHKAVLWQGDTLPPQYASMEFSYQPFTHEMQSSLIIDDEKREVEWDTGANVSLIKTNDVPKGRLANIDGRQLFIANNLEAGGDLIGSLDFVVLDFNEPPVDAIIGHNFFAKHVVFLDFAKKRIGIN